MLKVKGLKVKPFLRWLSGQQTGLEGISGACCGLCFWSLACTFSCLSLPLPAGGPRPRRRCSWGLDSSFLHSPRCPHTSHSRSPIS